MRNFPSKYRARKTVVDGITFDSKREAERYSELKGAENVGLIRCLKRQVRYELIPAQRDSNGKSLFRPVTYVADFTYYTPEGELIVEDVKGFRTKEYVLKKKMMYAFKGIKIIEV